MFCSKYLVLLCIFTLSKSDDVSSALLDVWLHVDLNETEPINLMEADLSEVNIDTTKPIAFICHGWIDNANVFWYAPAIEALLQKGYTVLAADWSKYADSFYFLVSAPDVDPVGAAFANFTVNLRDTLNISLASFHCIGHSLGAHVCGFLGQNVFALTGQNIGRITGLDPAGPGFNLASNSHRLSKDDATFVDVIHTNSGVFGIIGSVGHVDFWPNGGSLQIVSCIAGIIEYGPVCSHDICPIYFIESVSSTNFIATKCSSYTLYSIGGCRGKEQAIMGENVNTTQRGNFFLNTNALAPFAQGHTVLT